ncbi:hypothetical protein [Palaeococcus ferrophilus]|uniref:hypothetical protein n=1 Tax=Palaeococcus ferrophilus TaxID=83868 RepID=UPI00064E7ACE|nr:hypothetical protein [Palaeococcus ferrophilus]
MRRFLLFLLLSLVVISAACVGSGGQGSTTQVESLTTTSSHSSQVSSSTNPTQTQETTTTATTPKTPETWNMTLAWNVSTGGVPFMDLSPDGSLAAVIGWDRGVLYLVKPNGESTALKVWEGDNVQPTISGVAIKDGVAYVLAKYEEFAGVRKYSWNGKVGEERHGWGGSMSDQIVRSPSGNHLCYLVTAEATRQELYCDGAKMTLDGDDYVLTGVSDTGVVVLTRDDTGLIFKEGSGILSLNTSNVIAYNDRLIVSENGYLKVYDLNGTLLAEKKGYTFKTKGLLATGKYLFRNEPLEDTSVLTWNLTEVGTLPGFPKFANENFVVMKDDDFLRCYSLKDFHEVFSVEAPGADFVRLSDDGRAMLVSDGYGRYWLYIGD